MGPQNRQGSYAQPLGMQGFGPQSSQMPQFSPQNHNPGQQAAQGINPLNLQMMQKPMQAQKPMGSGQAYGFDQQPMHGGAQQPSPSGMDAQRLQHLLNAYFGNNTSLR